MKQFIPWNSQPLQAWARQHAPGTFIDIDGRSTHYVEQGTGSPLILIHGFFFDGYTWHGNLAALSARFRVIAPDLWGAGYSTREPLEHDYALYADQLLGLMDALQIDKASLVGHSMGGGVGLYFALRHRDRVDKLILVAPAGMPAAVPLIGRFANLPGVGELIYGLNSNLTRRMSLQSLWIHDARHITEDYFDNATRFQKVEGTSEIMLRMLRKQFFNTLQEDIRALGQLAVPILLVWGRHDKAISLQRGEEMQRLLPGSRLEIIEDCGHCPHDEQPERFNRLALEFLS